MKKWLTFALAVLTVAVAVPAVADVFVTATITKTKDIVVQESLTKTKFVEIDVLAEILPDGAAEVEAIVNVRNLGNVVDKNPDLDIFAVSRQVELTDSVQGNSGILGLNQDAGSMVNQANVVSLGVTVSPASFTEAQAAADQVNTENLVFRTELLFDFDNPDPAARIVGSINDNAGIVGVNQNAGNMNNQTNAVALAVGFGSQVALSEAALGQVNTTNAVEEINTVKLDLI